MIGSAGLILNTPSNGRSHALANFRAGLTGRELCVAGGLRRGDGPVDAEDRMPRVKVSSDGSGFVLEPGGARFRPLGFNYDHDSAGRLLEDYWDDEWATVERDFSEMRALGGNVVRIHLQFGRFMNAANSPNEKSLSRLGDLVRVAERNGLYLDITGLGCYHKRDVPEWYDGLSEEDRWATQVRFWEAVAGRCAPSPAVFCYDLMNEPVVPGGRRADKDWLGPAFAGKHFVQFVTLDPRDRTRSEVAKAWIDKLAAAVRRVDPRRLVTVGLVDWSLDRPGLTSGSSPRRPVRRSTSSRFTSIQKPESSTPPKRVAGVCDRQTDRGRRDLSFEVLSSGVVRLHGSHR